MLRRSSRLASSIGDEGSANVNRVFKRAALVAFHIALIDAGIDEFALAGFKSQLRS
jgi:pyruvoyl-dependent arginine decarboxylase (PvlArgDC)